MSESAPFELKDLSATAKLGRQLADLLFPGAVVALVGPLAPARPIWCAPSPRDWASPTAAQSAVQRSCSSRSTTSRLPIYHFDAYRLRSAADFFDLGAHEYFEGQGVCLVEWADRVSNCLPGEHLTVRLEITGATSRRAVVEGTGERCEAVVLRSGRGARNALTAWDQAASSEGAAGSGGTGTFLSTFTGLMNSNELGIRIVLSSASRTV